MACFVALLPVAAAGASAEGFVIGHLPCAAGRWHRRPSGLGSGVPSPSFRVRWTPRLAVAAMFLAMAIFGSNFAISRYAVGHGLAPTDLVFLRFGIAGPILLPYFLRLGWRSCAGIGWRRGLLLALTSGATIVLLMSFGVSYAPAAHGAALAPGTVTVVGVVYAMVLAGRLPPPLVLLGLLMAVAGLTTIAAAGSTSGSGTVLIGDALFFATGLLWGFYPVLLHRWRVPGLVGATVCAVLSIAYVPIYFACLHPRLLQVGWQIVLFQAVYQGIVNSVVGLWLWGHGVKVLGAAGTQLFPPLLPVIGASVAIPILGEWPGFAGTLGIGLIVTGIALSALAGRRRETGSGGDV